jgi:hypothetical protein
MISATCEYPAVGINIVSGLSKVARCESGMSFVSFEILQISKQDHPSLSIGILPID